MTSQFKHTKKSNIRRKWLQRLLILLIFVSASFVEIPALRVNTAYGTAIAAYRTENEIIVAADSRLTRGDGIPYLGPICKIRQFGDIFVASSGLISGVKTNFDIWEIVLMASIESQRLSGMVERFETLVRDRLRDAVALTKLLRPNEYQGQFVGKPAITVLFWGIEDSALTLKYLELYVYPRGVDGVLFSVDIRAYDCPGNLCPDGRGVVLLGERERNSQKDKELFIDPFLSRDAKCDVVDLARKFVQMMIDEDTINYGAPIDILSISKDGAKWIQRKDSCPEIKK